MPENEIRTIVLHLLRGAVPERANELSSLFKKYQANVAIMPNETGMTMRANKDGIKFSLNDVDVIWLFSFSAWRAIETYAPSIVGAEIGGLEVGAVLQQDPGSWPGGTRLQGKNVGRRSVCNRSKFFVGSMALRYSQGNQRPFVFDQSRCRSFRSGLSCPCVVLSPRNKARRVR